MSEETPSVDEIKDRLKTEIPVEEDEEPANKTERPRSDVAEELRQLGRQFGETLERAWHSEERQRIESEVREGVDSFVKEVDKALRQARKSETTAKVRQEAEEVRTKVESSDLGSRARQGMVQGLRWMSEGLNKLADQFTPVEKEPPGMDATEAPGSDEEPE